MNHPTTGKLNKVTWKSARSEAKKVNPKLAEIIDKLSPGDDYWLAKVSYSYGSSVMKRALLMLPNEKGQIVPITDSSIDPEIREGLSYNLQSNPVSLVLKNAFEIFLPLEDRNIPFGGLLSPGVAFGAWRILNQFHSEQPAFIWDMTAGSRSTFILPKITEAKKHLELKKKYEVTADVPLSLMEHWEVFKQLANHPKFKEPWGAEILYFPRQWFEHFKDSEWHAFYAYFQNNTWINGEFWRNQVIWNLVFSLILRYYSGKPSPYVVDTVKYLIYIGVGALPGMAPVLDELGGPFAEIQRIYTEEYGLRHYSPTIMQPSLFDMSHKQTAPVYYSLQFPNALEFKPNSRIRTSTVLDLHETRSLMIRCAQELSSDKFNIGETSLATLFRKVNFDYFHSGVELHTGMRNSAEMPKEDKHLITTLDHKVHDKFPETCSFVKGCIRLSV